MSDLIKRLRTTARNQCEAHNNIDQYDPAWERKPKDFCAWEAADEIERLTESNTILEYRLADSHRNVDRLTADIAADQKSGNDERLGYVERIKVLEYLYDQAIELQDREIEILTTDSPMDGVYILERLKKEMDILPETTEDAVQYLQDSYGEHFLLESYGL